MAEEVVVNFSAVDAAIKQVERARGLVVERERIALAKEQAQTTVKLIAWSAAAGALLIVSIGAAIWLARQRHVVQVEQRVTKQTIVREQPAPRDVPINKIKTNITQFRAIESSGLTFPNPHFVELAAGHQYRDSNMDRWEHAWCYATFERDGLTLRVSLETRTGGLTLPARVTESEKERLGLSDLDVAFLRSRCPWKAQ